jgi:hypothetical protein
LLIFDILGVVISSLAFKRQFVRFDAQIRRHSRQPFTSFQTGLPAEWEGYKSNIHKEALQQMDIRTWKRADIGKGRILKALIRAIEIKGNNLVRWPNRWGHKKQSHRALLDTQPNRAPCRDFEQWCVDFYQGRISDSEAFEHFQQLAGNSYDLIAYVFFLKDWTRFMPIAPETFDKAFALLGVELTTAHHCSWENYVRYNETLLAVQDALHEVAGVTDARLIDAHSFCWMLTDLKLPAPPPAAVIPLPEQVIGAQPFVTVSNSAAETGFTTTDEEHFAQRDAQRRRLGRLAEDIALQSERKRLKKAGHPSPKTAVIPVWNEIGRGYDILSCEIDGTPRYIEVKAAQHSGRRLGFVLTQNEWEKSQALPNYHFYLVINADSSRPIVRVLGGKDVVPGCLAPLNYMALLQIDAPAG